MTLSSDQFASRGLDAMLIVYSLLDDHPASAACESFIREHTNWFTTTLTLLEAKAVLTKVYAVDANLTSQQLSQFSAGPIEIIEVNLPITLAAMQIADTLEIDITDAVLVQTTRTRNVNILATDDRKLIQACHQVNIAVENPIDVSVRREMASWEMKNVDSVKTKPLLPNDAESPKTQIANVTLFAFFLKYETITQSPLNP